MNSFLPIWKLWSLNFWKWWTNDWHLMKFQLQLRPSHWNSFRILSIDVSRRLWTWIRLWIYITLPGFTIHIHYPPELFFLICHFFLRSEAYDEDTRRRISADKFRSAVEQLNGAKYHEIENHLSSAVNNILSTIRYERLQWDGPQLKQVSALHPLVTPYGYLLVFSPSLFLLI